MGVGGGGSRQEEVPAAEQRGAWDGWILRDSDVEAPKGRRDAGCMGWGQNPGDWKQEEVTEAGSGAPPVPLKQVLNSRDL